MSVQVPKSIKAIADVVKTVVNNNPNINSSYDIHPTILLEWENKIDHELFHQDLERYIGDLAVERNMSGKFDCTPWIR